jgi:hypothetical protein
MGGPYLVLYDVIQFIAIMDTTNEMQLYRLIYYFLSALHVSGDVFARHPEHLTIYSIW